ncbi:ABC transporter ATP-binding protein [Lysinimonas soli]|uniref:ABC transporter ATP-binding protein n=1 Tax=Lysinimonas soli TaxID=1074233 RepID=A0ABW0NJT1_9MICO
MISLSDVYGGYGGLDILSGFGIQVEKGSINCIVGPNGAGKSTVLKTLSGVLRPRRGSIVVDGIDLTGMSPTEIIRTGVVQVPQRHGLFATLTVRQNVMMGGYVDRRAAGRLRARYEELAGMFPLIAKRSAERAGSLSGGQRRIVEFARAMMLDPKVILLDEPTLGLDPQSRAVIHESTRAMNAMGTTILMVEQNVRFGLSLADRVTVMSAGAVVLEGTASEIADHPDLMGLFFGHAPEPRE